MNRDHPIDHGKGTGHIAIQGISRKWSGTALILVIYSHIAFFHLGEIYEIIYLCKKEKPRF